MSMVVRLGVIVAILAFLPAFGHAKDDISSFRQRLSPPFSEDPIALLKKFATWEKKQDYPDPSQRLDYVSAVFDLLGQEYPDVGSGIGITSEALRVLATLQTGSDSDRALAVRYEELLLLTRPDSTDQYQDLLPAGYLAYYVLLGLRGDIKVSPRIAVRRGLRLPPVFGWLDSLTTLLHDNSNSANVELGRAMAMGFAAYVGEATTRSERLARLGRMYFFLDAPDATTRRIACTVFHREGALPIEALTELFVGIGHPETLQLIKSKLPLSRDDRAQLSSVAIRYLALGEAPEIRRAAMEIIIAIGSGDEDSLEAMILAAAEDPDTDLRRKAQMALTREVSEPYQHLLLDHLTVYDNHPSVWNLLSIAIQKRPYFSIFLRLLDFRDVSLRHSHEEYTDTLIRLFDPSLFARQRHTRSQTNALNTLSGSRIRLVSQSSRAALGREFGGATRRCGRGVAEKAAPGQRRRSR